MYQNIVFNISFCRGEEELECATVFIIFQCVNDFWANACSRFECLSLCTYGCSFSRYEHQQKLATTTINDKIVMATKRRIQSRLYIHIYIIHVCISNKYKRKRID